MRVKEATLASVIASGLEFVVTPGTQLDFAGFSFGGIVGGLVAAKLGRRVRTLALLGPGGLGSSGAADATTRPNRSGSLAACRCEAGAP